MLPILIDSVFALTVALSLLTLFWALVVVGERVSQEAGGGRLDVWWP